MTFLMFPQSVWSGCCEATDCAVDWVSHHFDPEMQGVRGNIEVEGGALQTLAPRRRIVNITRKIAALRAAFSIFFKEIHLKKFTEINLEIFTEIRLENFADIQLENFVEIHLENIVEICLEHFEENNLENFAKINLENFEEINLENFAKIHLENVEEICLEKF